VPKIPLNSFDTKEGFEEHREWEKKLNSGNWSMVTWPEQYGGRGLNLIEWLIFEEEYYRAKAPARVNQNGVFLLGPTLMEYGSDKQKVGSVASKLKTLRKIEPYKGKGVREKGQYVLKKEGKKK